MVVFYKENYLNNAIYMNEKGGRKIIADGSENFPKETLIK